MLATEVVLEIIGVIPTVYLLSTVVDSGRRRAMAAPDVYTRVLYIGAIVYVVGIAFSTSLLATAMVLWVWRRLEVDLSAVDDEELRKRRLGVVKRRRRWIIVSMFAFGWIPALGSWMIWTGFVHVAKDLWVTLLMEIVIRDLRVCSYCSKKVVEIAVVWIVCTAMSMNFLRL